MNIFSRHQDQRIFLKQWAPILLVAIALWAVYIMIGPGLDYHACYTWMVNEPERLPANADYPWTLNPPWLAPFMAPFVSLPGQAGYIVFMAATIAAVIYGSRFFGGKTILTLLSAQMFWILWWGQIEGWAILGLVLAKIAFDRKSWPLMFLALTLASFKPHIGLVPVLVYWWWSGRQRWISMGSLMVVFLFSLFIWGPWPLWYMEGILKFAGDGHATIWTISIGLAALPLFIPALLLPLAPEQRVLALTATALLVSPYTPYYSTIILMVFNIPVWTYFFAFIGYLPTLLGTTLAWKAVMGLPISVLVWLYMPHIKLILSQIANRSQMMKAKP